MERLFVTLKEYTHIQRYTHIQKRKKNNEKQTKHNRIENDAYLLDRFSGKNERMLLLHADTVFDADVHASEMLRPAVVVRNVNAAIKPLRRAKSQIGLIS